MTVSTKGRRQVIGVITLCVVVCVVVAAVTMRGCTSNVAMMEESYSETFASDDISDVAIDFPAGSLSVGLADAGDDIAVVERVSGNAARQSTPVCELESGVLKIYYQQNPMFWLPIYWFGGNRRLEVSIPEDVAQSLEGFTLHVASGSADVQGITAKTMDAKVSSGQASLRDMGADAATFELSSGKLAVAQCELGNAEVHVSSGDAEIGGTMKSLRTGVTSGRAKIECANADIDEASIEVTSGSFTLALPDDCGFDAAVNKTAGGFDCGFDCQTRGETYVYGDGRTPIDIRITSGHVALEPLT